MPATEPPQDPADSRRPTVRNVYALLVDAYEHWRDRRTLRLGAGLAYYALFAVVPLLSLAAAIVARVVSTEEAKEFVVEALDGLFDADVEQVAEDLASSVSAGATGLGSFGFILLLVAASFLFLALQDALNVIWQAPVRVGIRNTIKRRLLALGVALIVALFFVSSLVIQAVVGLAERIVPGEIALIDSLSELITVAGSWVVGVFVIALLFKVLPYATVQWRAAIVGGAVTAVFISIGTALIGAYLSRFGASSLAGAAGGIALFLVWVYYEAQILLAGAVLTKVIGDRSRASTLSSGDPLNAGADRRS